MYGDDGDLIGLLGEDGTVNPPKKIEHIRVWSCDFNSSENNAYSFSSLSDSYSDRSFNLFPVYSLLIVYGYPVRCQKIE